jgi:hypothetical protein
MNLDLEVVRDLHPAVDQPSASEAASARAALMREIARAEKRRPGPRWVRPRRFFPLGLVGAAAAVAVAVVLAVSLRGGAANPSSAAAALLQRAARVAAASGGPRQLRPGEYWYVKSIWTNAGALVADASVPGGVLQIVNALSTTERQAWIGLDRRGRIVTRVVGPITFLSASARQQWIRAGRPRQVPGYNGSLPPNAFIRPYRQLLTLPSNVDALWRTLEHGAGKGSAAWKQHEIFTEIGDLLREDPIPATVRSALYLCAARIPGIQLLGVTHDGIGRPALAVALNETFDGTRDELLFDPHTLALLGESTVVIKPPPTYHVKPGSVRTASTYITSGIVERIGQVPRR